ncbi:hypothetical protein GCU49_21150, partial [Modestobacter roseus]|nr:hypothetical protein [Modestobacter roseus]
MSTAPDAPADPAPSPAPDPLRRAALIALAVAVPLVAALLVVVNVVGGNEEPDGDDDAVAEISGTTSAPRGDLPPVEVDTPEVTPEAELACPVLMDQL